MAGERVLGVLAGRDMPLELLGKWLESADLVLAADGAGDIVLEAGFRPHHIVGDLDSLTMAGMASGAEIHTDLDMDRTDCDKLLDYSQSIGVQRMVLTSVEGDRPDHWFSTLTSVARHHLHVVVATRTGLMQPLTMGKQTLDVSPGRTVSVMPWGTHARLSSKGLKWPLDDTELSAWGLISISNVAEDWEIELELHAGAAWVYVQFEPEEMPRWPT
ncbi:MAG: hypothetical protein HONBIEJF_02234 [Fimbriimonadaceae bacterium]|nr:hypothetical protein [Fimbriimonadaceae bacterium]